MAGSSGSRSIPGLRALYGSVAVSSLGDGMFSAAVPLAAALLTREPAAVAVVAAAEMLPWLLIAPIIGALVDRWPHRTIMIVSDLGRAVLLLTIALMVVTDTVTVAALAGLACAVMIGWMFFDTASQAMVADITIRDTKTLNRVNGFIGATTTATRDLIGPPAGSIMFSLRAWAPFVVDAASFVVSAIFVTRLPRADPGQAAATEPQVALSQSVLEGMRWLARHRTLRSFAAVIAVSNLAHSAAMATLVLFAQDILKISIAGYGFLLAASSVGGVVGGLLASRILDRVGDRRALALSTAVQGIAWFAIAAFREPVLAGAALSVSSLGTTLATVVVVGARQRLVPPDMLGRVTATFRMFGTGALPLGTMLGGTIASIWGLPAPLWAAGVVTLAALLLLSFARIDSSSRAAS